MRVVSACLITCLFFNAFPQKIAVISIPKCGSFLIYKCISLLTNKAPKHQPLFTGIEWGDDMWDKYFATNHEGLTSFAQQQVINKNIKVVFIIRDPRDQVVSAMYYLKKINVLNANSMTNAALLNDLIHNMCKWFKVAMISMPKTYDVTSFYREFLSWQHLPCVYTTTFEKLIGSKGGGDDVLQRQEIKNIAYHLEINFDDDVLNYIQKNIFGGSQTFRSGKIGAWKNEFSEKDKKDFKIIAGQLLIDLGYEQDFDW